jgi:hypothetical protein
VSLRQEDQGLLDCPRLRLPGWRPVRLTTTRLTVLAGRRRACAGTARVRHRGRDACQFAADRSVPPPGQRVEYREHLRWRGDRHGCRPGRRYVRHARGSLPGGDHRSHVLLSQHGLTGRPFFFLVVAWTWPAGAHVRTCRAGPSDPACPCGRPARHQRELPESPGLVPPARPAAVPAMIGPGTPHVPPASSLRRAAGKPAPDRRAGHAAYDTRTSYRRHRPWV